MRYHTRTPKPPASISVNASASSARRLYNPPYNRPHPTLRCRAKTSARQVPSSTVADLLASPTNRTAPGSGKHGRRCCGSWSSERRAGQERIPPAREDGCEHTGIGTPLRVRIRGVGFCAVLPAHRRGENLPGNTCDTSVAMREIPTDRPTCLPHSSPASKQGTHPHTQLPIYLSTYLHSYLSLYLFSFLSSSFILLLLWVCG